MPGSSRMPVSLRGSIESVAKRRPTVSPTLSILNIDL